jgi:hypothetical protein
MEYLELTEEHRLHIRAQHVLDLESRLYALELHEEEEPGTSPERVAAMNEIVRRLAVHRAFLAPTVDADHEPEPSAHGEVGPGV